MSQEVQKEEEKENQTTAAYKVYENVIIFKDLQINMDETLKKYQEEQIGPDILKYNVISLPDNEKIQDDSKLKIFCEERDFNGFLQNKDKQVQLNRFSMKSPKPELSQIKKLLLSMHVGEESWFKISNFQTQNELLNENDKQTTVIRYFRIKVVEQQLIEKPLDLTTLENRFLQFEKFRKDGNKLFNNSLFENAIKKYQKGINFMEAWPRIHEQDQQVQQKKKYYYQLFCSNMAQSYILLKEYEKAIMILEDIIPQCRGNEFEIKSYYRIIVCYMKTRDFDKAERYLREVKHVCQLDVGQSQLFNWLENECKPLKKVKI
ncbi:unnamed protein product (macronuclear) [Paramecium tetraurelia]|uniref:BDBT FKBP like N-terminal domain-containing protein n=1 Tax=Paramecium tetraurelia TaxID=5888 RepID=A0DQ62_PARTE|nr:uncharacterized protein GSPATT00002579001 [Paramecium tetraurelia]CAK85179.1 unnamed protein product [Paramecium tetraurelia]|eukprot:XP_001452576.1 hypothetical protein (macronuclear) [Paramecium tetraurelia strain d4-2]